MREYCPFIFKFLFSEDGTQGTESIIKFRCQSCQNLLGDESKKDDFVQLWHHAVILNPDRQPSKAERPSLLPTLPNPSALETFLLLIGGLCSDHGWLPIKIKLLSLDPQILLNLWILEPDLKVLKISRQSEKVQEETESEHEETGTLSLMKVMHHQESHQEKTRENWDQELSELPPEVVHAGLKHLQENSLMIPQGHRRDSNFHISYISLDAVLLC